MIPSCIAIKLGIIPHLIEKLGNFSIGFKYKYKHSPSEVGLTTESERSTFISISSKQVGFGSVY